MEKRYYTYDDKGNPSIAPFSIQDLIQQNLKPDTIVCPEFGEPDMISNIPKLQETTAWTPPKLSEKKRNFILSKKSKNIALASLMAVVIGGGTYYAAAQKSKANLQAAIEMDNIQKTEAALQRSIDTLDNVYMGLVSQTKIKEVEYDKAKKENVDLKEREVFLNGQIASVQASKRNNERGRDDADEKAKSYFCVLDCATEARKVRDNYKDAIAQNEQTIVSYTTDIRTINDIKLPAAAEKVASVKNEIDELVQQEKAVETDIEKLKLEKKRIITKPIYIKDKK